MKFNLVEKLTKTFKTDLLAAFIHIKHNSKTQELDLSNPLKELDKDLFEGELFAKAKKEGFTGDKNQIHVASLFKKSIENVMLVGLGGTTQGDNEDIRTGCGRIFKHANQKRHVKISFMLPKTSEIPDYDLVQTIVESTILASYSFDKYKKQDSHKKPVFVKTIEIVVNTKVTSELKQAISRGQNIASSVLLTRNLINEPPIILNPERFSQEAQKVAQEVGLSFDVLDEKKLKAQKMELMLAVGQGAGDYAPPRLIRLAHKAKKKTAKTIVLVGKGVTFDSGGLDIKPADGMLDMKADMSGAGVVLGVLRAVSLLNLNINVVGYLACVENGVDAKSYHPGDIFQAKNGLFVEISNTDAEGRLVLADALTFAQEKDKPDTIIDIATLTGACMVALGLNRAGLFANDDHLASSLLQLERKTGEKFWRLPLDKELLEGLKTPNADIKNCGSRWGGSITAALFLEQFIEKGAKWAHLDIAGPAHSNKASNYCTAGGTGFSVRTLVEYLSSQQD